MTVDYLKALGESHNDLVNQIRLIQGLTINTQHGYNFIVAALKILHPNITEAELVEGITDGPHDHQIDAIIIKDGFVDIYDFKGNLGYGESDIRLFKDSVRSLFFVRNQSDGRNTRLTNQLENSLVAIDSGAKVRIRVVRMNPAQAPEDILDIIKELNYGSIVQHKIYSGKNLINDYLSIDTTPINYTWPVNIKIENNQGNETQTIILRKPSDSSIESLYCRLSLKSLVDLYYSQTPNQIIFEANVRSLQNDRKIKDEMLASLSTANQAKQFHKLHNGITIVCDSISSISDTRFNIENPQIVNGCQTITNLSLEFVSDRDSNKLKNGSVLCKIFHASRPEVERICLASNSQTNINPWDLRTNDPIQKEIESYLNLNGIQYDRKNKNRGNNDLTFIELGQWLYSTIHRHPMASKNKRRSIFDASPGNIYHTVFHDNLDLKEVLKIVRDGIFIRNKLRQIQPVFEKQADLHFLAAFFILKNKNWQQETKFRRIRDKITETIHYMKRTYDSEMKYDTMFAKRSETWQDLEGRLRGLL